MNTRQMLEMNKATYQNFYAKQEWFLRYPADWVLRFYSMYLKDHIPNGRVLDYGYGGGNNSLFFIERGYETYGIEVAEAALELIKTNLKSHGLGVKYAENFKIVPPDSISLPFKDNFFDFIISNQVLYYLASEEHIKKVCKEFHRCLRPGGIVFFTMMGPKNYYIVYHAKQIHNERVYEIAIEDPSHRLYGLRELIYLVRDERELKGLFSDFECVSIGYFDQSMFNVMSNFHWIFIGKKHS